MAEYNDYDLARLIRAELAKLQLNRLERLLSEMDGANTETKALATLEWKQVDVASGVVTGYGATYDLDLSHDEIAPGAFTRTLEKARAFAARYKSATLFPVLWQHQREEPIGFVSQAGEDGHGLRCTFVLDVESPRGKQALVGLKNGTLSFSIGYRPVSYTWKGSTRILQTIDLLEVSVVTFPMNREARAIPDPGGAR